VTPGQRPSSPEGHAAEGDAARLDAVDGNVAPTELIATFPETLRRVRDGARFCGLFAMAAKGGEVELRAVVSEDGVLAVEDVAVGERGYASLSPEIPAADWYERRLRDLVGVEPVGHAGCEPLVFPVPPGAHPPLGREGDPTVALSPDPTPPVPHVHGEGVFAIPYGPVRSGVFEAVEYLVETSGEDIPYLRTRIFYKHRGIESRFTDMSVEEGVLLAERVEGVASVAHALAFSAAVEQLGEVAVTPQAELVRVVHAELERVANHLDTMVRHTEAAGQAVAYAVLSHHKERVQRLRARLCGSRFGRGVVVPGGLAQPLRIRPAEVLTAVAPLQQRIAEDVRRLMDTPSFVDRLRGTGVLSRDDARRFALVGPVGRASGEMEDLRTSRPYGGYARLGHRVLERRLGGDALSRQLVRIDEIAGAFHLLRQAIDLLSELGEPVSWREPVPMVSGRAIGWAEAPHGELLSVVEVDSGRLTHVTQRSASFHNLAAYSSAFPKDIFTDVAFIEASFGLSIAGAAC
jgi:formate hydrogenlyase subunit 5